MLIELVKNYLYILVKMPCVREVLQTSSRSLATALKTTLLMFPPLNLGLMFPLLCLYINGDKWCPESFSPTRVPGCDDPRCCAALADVLWTLEL